MNSTYSTTRSAFGYILVSVPTVRLVKRGTPGAFTPLDSNQVSLGEAATPWSTANVVTAIDQQNNKTGVSKKQRWTRTTGASDSRVGKAKIAVRAQHHDVGAVIVVKITAPKQAVPANNRWYSTVGECCGNSATILVPGQVELEETQFDMECGNKGG
jgi:hypothetical protein